MGQNNDSKTEGSNLLQIKIASDMEKKLLNVLVCPNCKGPLQYDEKAQELICQKEKLAFPIREGIPSMLIDEAREITG